MTSGVETMEMVRVGLSLKGQLKETHFQIHVSRLPYASKIHLCSIETVNFPAVRPPLPVIQTSTSLSLFPRQKLPCLKISASYTIPAK